MAWAFVPSLGKLILGLFQLLLFGSELFMRETPPRLDQHGLLLILYLFLLLLDDRYIEPALGYLALKKVSKGGQLLGKVDDTITGGKVTDWTENISDPILKKRDDFVEWACGNRSSAATHQVQYASTGIMMAKGSPSAPTGDSKCLAEQILGKSDKKDDFPSKTQDTNTKSADSFYQGLKNSKTYKPVQYEGTTKVDGKVRDISRRVYQRKDINWNVIDPETGMTNLERAKDGRPPLGQDGKPLQLHHIIQKEAGPMVEIVEMTHRQYKKQLHGLVGKGQSFRNDPVLDKQYNNFRAKYWKWRAEQIQKEADKK
ncbi:A nuclease of the HNH/ENDO VII superfamily with conserved LHH [Melghirimyces thermohalophilus]|uniref:A nuclease of the HNH/ENDO VII superfamily with conserved LHH n=1 Tax=Melghirimyces thermohalophilus TaxID=1236220 RepID=A0A1G6PK06_9BACL|nr:HNH/ENDO VII family nuclease [Melghirimyces thermohalophilus]SDC80503.1 A nuclease of the HNH/ENDO VII superfamily with conserved LHH [Melghirimyces thermohalophilus]